MRVGRNKRGSQIKTKSFIYCRLQNYWPVFSQHITFLLFFTKAEIVSKTESAISESNDKHAILM